MEIDEFLEKLQNVRASGDGYTALCPAHEDHKPSLSITEAENTILINCFAGCKRADILRSMGLTETDLHPPQEDIVYIYRDEKGRPLYEKIRKYPKDFVTRRYVGDSKEWGLEGTRRVLYGLPELLSADPGKWVFLCEGEKDAEAIRLAGGISTTYGGASDWQEEYADVLKGRHVTVVQHDDDAGRKTAAKILLDLRRHKAATIRLVQARQGNDAADHLSAGYNLSDFTEPSLFTPYDFTKPAPPVDWLFEGYIARGDLVLLAGKPKLGKSWLSMALAVAMANGHGYLLNRNIANGRVLYFDEENPEDVAHSRMVRALGHKAPDKLRYVLHGGLRLDTHPELLTQETINYQPVLIVIDSLSAVQTKEENSRSEMGEILRGVLKPLAVETGAAILLIHHHDKAGYGPRGSGDIEAAVDSIINLKGTPGAGVFTLETQSRRRKSAHERLLVKLVDLPGVGTRLEGSILE